MSLDIEELESKRTDYRRANGAPMIVDRDGKNQRYSRPSSYAKPLDDESALVFWKIDRACIGVARDRALQARWAAANSEGDNLREEREKLREDSISAGRGSEAADIGTALHAMSVRFERGEVGFLPPEPYLTSLTAYMGQMRRLGLETVRYEFHTVNEQYRCAGTADRLYEVCSPLVTPNGDVLPVGTLLVGDLKTGEKLQYSKASYAVQCALYAAGSLYDVVEDCFLATPPINQEWAIIVHMPADDPGVCEFLWIDLEIGRWGCYLVEQIKLWRKNWRSGEFPMPPVECDSDLVRSFDEGPVVLSPDCGEPLTGHIEWAKERLTYIARHEQAKKRLLLLWPADLPTPKQGIKNMEQVLAVNALLSTVEAEYSLSFVPMPASILGTGPSTHRKGK